MGSGKDKHVVTFPRSIGITIIVCYSNTLWLNVDLGYLGYTYPACFLRHKDRAQQLERNNKKLLERAAQSGMLTGGIWRPLAVLGKSEMGREHGTLCSHTRLVIYEHDPIFKTHIWKIMEVKTLCFQSKKSVMAISCDLHLLSLFERW